MAALLALCCEGAALGWLLLSLHGSACEDVLNKLNAKKILRQFRDPASRDTMRVDYCRFGTPWRKRTRVALNIPKLRGLRRLCACEKPHVQLRGQHPLEATLD